MTRLLWLWYCRFRCSQPRAIASVYIHIYIGKRAKGMEWNGKEVRKEGEEDKSGGRCGAPGAFFLVDQSGKVRRSSSVFCGLESPGELRVSIYVISPRRYSPATGGLKNTKNQPPGVREKDKETGEDSSCFCDPYIYTG